MTVALDTMTLIWGIQCGGNPKQPDLREMQCRAHILIEILRDSKDRVIIPCIAVAELLLGVESKDHDTFVAALQKNFFCPPFDIRASEIAAKLHLDHKHIPVEDKQTRKVIRADIMILATAKAAGATTVYSHDARCRRMAGLVGIAGKDLPDRHPDVYRHNELRRQFKLPTDSEESA